MPKAAEIHYLNMCRSGKSRSKSTKKQRLQRPKTYTSFDYRYRIGDGQFYRCDCPNRIWHEDYRGKLLAPQT